MSLAALDEVTMVLMPDIMNLNGDGAQGAILILVLALRVLINRAEERR